MQKQNMYNYNLFGNEKVAEQFPFVKSCYGIHDF